MGSAMGARALLQGAETHSNSRTFPPGSYTLNTLATGLGGASYVVKQPLEIGTDSIEDLPVSAVTPFEMKGHLTADASPELKLPSIKIYALPVDEVIAALVMGSPQDSGDFTLTNLTPGRFKLALTGFPSTYYVKDIALGNQAVTGDEVEIPNGAAPLSITLGQSKAEVVGAVRDDKGNPLKGAFIALQSDPKRPFHQKGTLTDGSGVFRLANVPPGEYYLFATDDIPAGALEDEEFIKPFLSKAKHIRVSEGARVNQDLELLPSHE